MKWWAGSFFWRTLAVLVVALVASQAASFLLFRQQVQQPRIGMAIGSFVSHLKTIHAALSTLPPGAERDFLERLAEKEGIRVFPARGETPGLPAGDRPGMRMFRERIKALFGEDAEVFARPGSPGEFSVLKVFAEHPREPLSRDKLMDRARGREHESYDRSIDVQVSRLRKLLGEDPQSPRYIQTVWGFGYVFIPDGTPHK